MGGIENLQLGINWQIFG